MARNIWDFIIPQMEANARIQRSKDHPDFAVIEKPYPLKLENLILEATTIKLNEISYSLEETENGFNFLIDGLKVEEILTTKTSREVMKNVAMRILSGRKIEVKQMQFEFGCAFYLPTGLEIKVRNLILPHYDDRQANHNKDDLESIKPFLSQDGLPLESLEVFDLTAKNDEIFKSTQKIIFNYYGDWDVFRLLNQRVHVKGDIWGFLNAEQISNLWTGIPPPFGRHYSVENLDQHDYDGFMECIETHARKWTSESRACNPEMPHCASWKKNDVAEINVYMETASQEGPYTWHIRLDPIGTATLDPDQEEGLEEYQYPGF